MLRARDVVRVSMGHYTVPAEFPRLQELDPWRVTFAHDLAIWERGT
ncbi:MAG TPA: hypothetical protein VEP48_01060 [Methylomirabilota bacterium]|nr:hypothetical protein [Methylomirabilota bacterium]